MKPITTIIILVALLLPGTPCLGSSEHDAKRENARLAAKMLIGRLKEKTKSRAIDQDSLAEEVLKNKEQHRLKSESRTKLEEMARKNLAEGFKEDVKRILYQLDSNRPDGVQSWFSSEDRAGFLSRPVAEINANISSNFNRVFESVRDRVCNYQWERITHDAYPSESDLDNKGRSELEDELLSRIQASQTETVFEENTQKLKGVVGKILDDAYSQLNGQMNTVDGSEGGPGKTEESIRSHIKSQLIGYRTAQSAEKKGNDTPNKVYGTFTSVTAALQKRSSYLVGKKLLDYLKRTEVPLDVEKLKTVIKQDLKTHSNRENSKRVLKAGLSSSFVDVLARDYSSTVDKDKRQDFKAKVRTMMGKGEFSERLSIMIEGSLEKYLDKARSDVSKEQFEGTFKPLAAPTWEPGYPMIDRFYGGVGISIPKPLELPGISSGRFAENELLEETKSMVEDAEKRIIGAGLKALRDQMSLSKNVQDVMRSRIKELPELPTFEKLIQQYTEEVISRWKGAGKFVPNTGRRDAYATLFPRVMEDIRQRAKYILPFEMARRKQVTEARKEAERQARIEAQRKQEEERKKAEAKPDPGSENPGTSQNQGRTQGPGSGRQQSPRSGGGGGIEGTGKGGGKGSGSGSGSGPGGGGGDKKGDVYGHANVIIDIDYNNGRITANVMFSEQETRNFSFEIGAGGAIDPFKLKMDMAKTQAIFEKWLRGIDTAGKKEFHLFVLARVFDGRVQYGIVFNFRQSLKNAVESVKNPKLKVRWYDGIFDTNDKGKWKIPEDIRKRLFQSQLA